MRAKTHGGRRIVRQRPAHRLAATIGEAVVGRLAGTLTKAALVRCENVLGRYDVTTDC